MNKEIILAFVLVLGSTSSSFAKLSEKDKSEVAAMHWVSASNIRLEKSSSTIVNLPNHSAIIRDEARRLRDLIDASGNDRIEADVVNLTNSSELVYEWTQAGFVSSDDWKDIDPDSFLSQMREQDAAANKVRLQRGLPTLTTTGWIHKPGLNQDNHTVSWAIRAVRGNGEDVLNFVALKLGRYGFERIAWIVAPNSIQGTNDLLLAISDHKFDNGARYTDYIAGKDRSAEYGIAGLVAGALGVKIIKAAGLGAAFIALKKFAFLLILPFVYAWRKLAGLFRRRPSNLA